jgi:hypothetical protein
MKSLFAILSILLVALVLPVSAKKGPKHTEGPELKIVSVDAVRIAVSLGKSGEEHIEYKITDKTIVTLNGAPVAARDLRVGMVCRIEAGPDKVATAVHAKDAPAHPSKHRVG